MDVHELTAAYALDALEADEAEAYERHLERCEQCSAQLAELNEAAGALAFGTVAPVPPPRLRSAILDAAATASGDVVPLLRRPRVVRGLAVAAAAAACAAVGFGVAATQSNRPRLVAVVVLGPNRTASLRVSGLAAAPRGKTYEAWVIPAGGRPERAGLFRGGAPTSVRLRPAVPKRAVVAVTIERAGGVSSPTTSPIFTAQT